ncbi:MAG: enoyl-CoA hydratase/isomerase family protein [Novosphingobium sp.]
MAARASASFQFGAFRMDVGEDGVALLRLDRPPVNAVSVEVYDALGRIVDHVVASDSVRVLVWTEPEEARAWCGGADLHDFDGIDVEGRKARYSFINAQLPRFYRIDRPVIAAIRRPAIGIGMILAALCDMRIAAEDAMFACPEIDYGLVAGGAGLFAHVNMPEAKVREMLFSGARFAASELEPTGFFNYVLPAADVLPRAMDLARRIAAKSLPSIRARKVASARLEGMSWSDAYIDAQSLTAQLTAGHDGGEAVRAFLDRRTPHLEDR